MKTVVCATRGGAGSRAVREKAIEYASQRNCKLVFLFVIDTSSLDAGEEKLRSAVRDELAWLGQALLRIAQQRAEIAEIDSEIVIREGLVREEIASFLKERSADLLLIGAPRGTTTAVFGDDTVEQFAADIEREAGVPVELVRPPLIAEDANGSTPEATNA